MNENDKFYKFFQKYQGRNFINFLVKYRDELIKSAFAWTFESFFESFSPSTDDFPLTIIATQKYGQNLISINSRLDILVVFKESKGYNLKPFLKTLEENLQKTGLNLRIKITEIDAIYENFKDNLKSKSELCLVRYICGSKSLYKLSRDEINRLKEYEKEQFLTHHIKRFLPLDKIPFLAQEPNLKTWYGGTDDIYALNCILATLGGENVVRLSNIKFVDEKKISQFNLCVDFLLTLKSALNLINNEDVFSEKNIDEVTNLMQTKSKKAQDTNVRISQKILSSLKNIALFARFIVSTLIRNNSRSLSIMQKKIARQKSGLYVINNTIFTPLHKKTPSATTLLKELNSLKDLDYKFDISTIFYIKSVISDTDEAQNINDEIKKLLVRNNAFCILEALLDAGVLGLFIKPMENISQLTKYDGYHKFSVDEHSIISVKFLENIKDKFIKNLYSELCMEGKTMLKAVTLMHDVGKGVTETEHEIVGANIFRAYANRLELSQNATNIGVLLIRHHNLMNDVANREDIYSERVIFSFISKLGEKKVLNLLYILTYCVINATDESIYSAYTARLLRKLYDLSLQRFDDAELLDEATRRVKKEQSIKRHDEFEKLSSDKQNKIFEISSNLIFAKYSVLELINIANRAFLCNDMEFEIENSQGLSVKIISTKRLNLSALLNIMANFDLGYMEIYELFNDKFFVRLEFNKNAKKDEILSLKAKAKEALKSNEILEISKPIIKKDEILLDLNHSEEYAKLSINTKDQRGLMAYVMKIFSDMGCKIGSAKVQTIKNRTRNLFMISKNDALCYNYEQILNQLISE